LPAPLGYLDRGKGKAKDIDPVMAPVVAKAFELYATQQYSLHRLLAEVNRMGLRNRQGAAISLTGLSTVLNNPFYMGLVCVKRTGELFPGAHRPLVSKSLFDRVQLILEGKTVDRQVRHDFTYRRLVRCAGCGRSLIGELQKGHVYYRCQTRECPTKTTREEVIENKITATVVELELDEEEIAYIREWMEETRLRQDSLRDEELQSTKLRLDGVRNRLNRLTDAFIDGMVEKPLFEERKATLVIEEREIREHIHDLEARNGLGLRKLEEFLELAKDAPFLYKNADPDEKRDLVRNLFSNLRLIDKNVSVEPHPSVQVLVNRPKITYGTPYRVIHRTWNTILERLLKHFSGSKSELEASKVAAV